MTMTELADLILARLYELASEHNIRDYLSLNEIAMLFGETDNIKIMRVGELLESQNYIKAQYTQAAEVTMGQLTALGEHYVESGGNFEIINHYFRNPTQYIVNYYDSRTTMKNVEKSNIVINSKRVTQTININPEINNLIEKIVSVLKSDESLNQEKLDVCLYAINSIKDELSSRSKDETKIKANLEVLKQVPSIGSFLIALSQLIF